ncbi:MAG: ABC transporter ATP-binding protein [Patescibacteria group bacterium]|jgi:ABC-2 type transport system ATP-binding protein
MSPQFVLQAEGLCKKFPDKGKEFVAVDNVSFNLKKGEILGFLGPNGAGKTTTIQMLLGILKPTSGTVSYFGLPFEQHREKILERINFSSTYTNLPWRLSPHEVLTYMMLLYDIPDRKKRLKEVLTSFRLEEFEHKEISSLSAGQTTRLNLAKAFMNNPEVLLLDEPTASLDPETADYIRKFILKEQESRQLSIVFTSHNMAEVEEICDRVIIINNGKIIAEDTPANLPKKIKFSELNLVMVDGLKRTVELCRNMKLETSVNERSINIRIEENRIAEFLNALAGKNIQYDQISIKKPDLEEFFLEIIKEKK